VIVPGLSTTHSPLIRGEFSVREIWGERERDDLCDPRRSKFDNKTQHIHTGVLLSARISPNAAQWNNRFIFYRRGVLVTVFDEMFY
jgi:hypothetical protein